MTTYQFSPGDVIQPFEEPFIKYLNASCKESLCNHCFKKPERILRCTACKRVSYCNPDCQREDWRYAHKVECKLYALQILPVDDDTTDQIVRLMVYLRLHKGRAEERFQLYNGTERCFNYLQDHVIRLKKVPEIAKAMKILSRHLTSSKLFTAEECTYDNVIKLFGIWKTNGFAVANDTDTKVIGAGLYLLGSAFDHSCRPNAMRVIDDKFRMQIRCVEAIPAGETPKIAYIAGIKATEERQKVLKERYNFDCQCVLCAQEKHSGPAVRYAALITHRDCLKDVAFYTDTEIESTKTIATEMEKIACPYDERITNLYSNSLTRLVLSLAGPFAFKITLAKLKAFAAEVEERMRITFGADHRDYQYYMANVKPLIQDL